LDPAWAPPAESLYRLSLEQYEAMVASGVFTHRDRFHLIRGLLVAKMTRNTPHTTADLLCGDALEPIIPPGWHVRPGKPIRIPGQTSKPEPDRSVARGGIRTGNSCRFFLASLRGATDRGEKLVSLGLCREIGSLVCSRRGE
jgi:hypothetical protein